MPEANYRFNAGSLESAGHLRRSLESLPHCRAPVLVLRAATKC